MRNLVACDVDHNGNAHPPLWFAQRNGSYRNDWTLAE